MCRGREGTLERGWEQGRCAGKAGWCGGKGGRKQLLGPRAPRLARVQLRGGFHGTSQLLLPLAAPKAVIKCAGRPTITGGRCWGALGERWAPAAAWRSLPRELCCAACAAPRARTGSASCHGPGQGRDQCPCVPRQSRDQTSPCSRQDRDQCPCDPGRTGTNIPIATRDPCPHGPRQGKDPCVHTLREGRDLCPMAPGRTGISVPWPQEAQGSMPHGPRQDRDQYSFFH